MQTRMRAACLQLSRAPKCRYVILDKKKELKELLTENVRHPQTWWKKATDAKSVSLSLVTYVLKLGPNEKESCREFKISLSRGLKLLHALGDSRALSKSLNRLTFSLVTMEILNLFLSPFVVFLQLSDTFADSRALSKSLNYRQLPLTFGPSFRNNHQTLCAMVLNLVPWMACVCRVTAR